MSDLLKKLREPFRKEELEFRVGATNNDKSMGLALAYVQARAIQNRLDELFGVDGWTVSYKEISAGFICSLSIKINDRWVTKEDGAGMTEYESVKGGISNAFKRVASSGFGIGRYLYNAKKNWYPIRQQGKGYIFTETPVLELNDEIEIKKREDIDKIVERAENNKIVIDFGKYKGMTLDKIYEKDKSYIKYLKENAKDKKILEACIELIA
ncbi:MAG: Rad52/Rad22 family DNA repair protein [Fusobacterium sp.]|uniref:Rad52/Rad22 family DNA repair protein n=1 Tax=Fusobacterium sp. TaxID=68766 RepID=UPI002A748AF4|nr:Rad52/Rad22 family DNA repair protein [Fusobacterium sp.]MDY3058927.1 Rad52/Rad22 family DNA repair protein [Fusobacterium sp.]